MVASTILTNGKIYTQDPEQPWAEAVAIQGQRIVKVGSLAQVNKFRIETTWSIDLDGRFAMPGLIDAHVHPVLGGMEVATQCLFPPTAGPDTIAATLDKCIQENPDSPWIVGGRWDSTFFDRHDIGTPITWLDEISSDRAFSLADDTGHNRWVNSKALELVGFNRDTHVEGGELGRDANGEPNGLLMEAAMWPVLRAINEQMKPTAAQYLEAARTSLEGASRYGFTGIKEAGDADQGVIAYKALDDAGELKVHLVACIAVRTREDGSLDLESLQRLREENRGHHVNTDCAKIFLDGVPSGARTAAMLEDYAPEVEGGPTHNGKLLVDPETLKQWMAKLDSMGMTVKVHTAGDRAVRVTLDAIEHAREVNGDSGLRHELAHSGLIDEADIPRFAELNAVADMSPSIWYPSPIIDAIVAALGERGERYWPFKDLLDAGADVIAGSDWPAVIPDMDPWTGIEAMITRQHPKGKYPGTYWAEQAITLEQALDIATLAGAKALRMEQDIGSIEVGKLADIIVLNHNLFEIPAEAISDTKVEMTLFEGKIVYQAPL